jgi:lipopolysaccharide transport system ATP-binding protein
VTTAISACDVGKRYYLSHEARQPYLTLRDALASGVQGLAKKMLGAGPGTRSSTREEFWALRDVSFRIQQGERVGIIGRNGAGKSTLLKLLSRITEPTTGRIALRGRVASLLEVGTGFHPELSGRENIFLNGAILGMPKAEIRRKFEEIVAFANIERFLDTPVKRYSSGMYVRLAFAVAAHLDPEILVVDEVLSVGDAEFQKKCLGKMSEVGNAGRTVLFVSHNIQAIRQLCDRVLLLREGKVVADGPTGHIVQQYLASVGANSASDRIDDAIDALPPDPSFRLESVALSQDGKPVHGQIANGTALEVEIQYLVLQRTAGMRVFFDLMDTEETLLFRSFHDEDSEGVPAMEPGRYASRARIPGDLLAPTQYRLQVLATVYDVRMCIPYPGIGITLNVAATGRANRGYLGEPIRGKLAPVIPWVTSCLGAIAPGGNR